jgi:hypothetical protein
MQFALLLALMPLVCLLYGTALIGAEVEQRTLVYLTTRRLHRATVLLVRFAATWAALTVLFGLAMLALHLSLTLHAQATTIPHSSSAWRPWHDLQAYLSIAPAGAAAFLAVFTTISLVFSRPLIVSLIYLVVFEVVLGNLPVPARRLSISHPLRQTIVHQIPRVRQVYDLPREVVGLIYPVNETGVWTLLAIVAVLLGMACVLMTARELVPARVSRD